MPSNAMKISQLVAHLQALQSQHGDLDCTLGLAADATLAAIDTRLIGVAIELPWQRLAHPVVVFGNIRSARLIGQPAGVVGPHAEHHHRMREPLPR